MRRLLFICVIYFTESHCLAPVMSPLQLSILFRHLLLMFFANDKAVNEAPNQGYKTKNENEQSDPPRECRFEKLANDHKS